jgi:hypothetical protein
MIRALGTLGGKRTLICGLSEGNLERLRQNKPILLNLDDMDPGVRIEQVMICWGQTEQSLVELFSSGGLINEETRFPSSKTLRTADELLGKKRKK